MILLIDGDILIYRALYQYRGIRGVFDNMGTSTGLLRYCLNQVLKTYINKYLPSKVVICIKIEEGKYFRHTIADNYKGHRPDTPEEIKILRELSREIEHTIYSSGDIETDDLIGMYMSDPTITDEIICLSGDKDLLQIPGTHASFMNNKITNVDYIGTFELIRDKGKSPKLITTGFIHVCRQLLEGDKIDNIKGIKGFGPVKIYNLLEEWSIEDESSLPTLLKKVEQCYEDKDLFIKNLQLIWILRTEIHEDTLKYSYVLDQLPKQQEIINKQLTFRDYLNYVKEL